MSWRRMFSWFLACLSLFLLTGVVASAQTTGDIEGKVTETSGSPLPGVTLEATSPRLQGTRVTVSGHNGTYRFPGVPPGEYQVRATLENFDPAQDNTTVALDATLTLDLTMRLSARETIVVSGEAPLIDLTSTTTGTNYTSKVITKLPVARNYADIVRSNPGVFVDRGDTQGRSLALAIYGATSVENQWIIDSRARDIARTTPSSRRETASAPDAAGPCGSQHASLHFRSDRRRHRD